MPSGRTAVLLAILGAMLQAVSGGLYFAAAGFSIQANNDPAVLLAVGGNSAPAFRWASVVDLFGYLLIAPLVAYLYQRFRREPHSVLHAAAGFGYVLVGAIGATVMLVAGPPLLREYVSLAAGDPQRAAISTTFVTLYQIVVIGLWQILEAVPGGVWLLGVGASLHRDRQRARAGVAYALGGLLLLLAALRLMGV